MSTSSLLAVVLLKPRAVMAYWLESTRTRGWAQAVMASSSSPGDLLPVEYSSGCEEPVLVPCGSAFGLLRADDCFRPQLVSPCAGPLRTATGRPHGRRPWNGLCGQALSLLVSSPPRSPWRARARCPQRERKA